MIFVALLFATSPSGVYSERTVTELVTSHWFFGGAMLLTLIAISAVLIIWCLYGLSMWWSWIDDSMFDRIDNVATRTAKTLITSLAPFVTPPRLSEAIGAFSLSMVIMIAIGTVVWPLLIIVGVFGVISFGIREARRAHKRVDKLNEVR